MLISAKNKEIFNTAVVLPTYYLSYKNFIAKIK